MKAAIGYILAVAVTICGCLLITATLVHSIQLMVALGVVAILACAVCGVVCLLP